MIQQRRFPRTALALGIATALLATAPGFAQQTSSDTAKPNQPETQLIAAKPDVSTMSAEQKMAYLAHTGRIAMSHVESARVQLQGKHNDAAKHQLGEAKTLLTEVTSHTKEKMLPLLARIGFTEQFDVTEAVTQKLNGVNAHVINGEHDKVVEIMKETGAAMAYTYAEVPLAGTIAKIDAALKALEANSADKAEQELNTAIDEIHLETFTVEASAG